MLRRGGPSIAYLYTFTFRLGIRFTWRWLRRCIARLFLKVVQSHRNIIRQTCRMRLSLRALEPKAISCSERWGPSLSFRPLPRPPCIEENSFEEAAPISLVHFRIALVIVVVRNWVETSMDGDEKVCLLQLASNSTRNLYIYICL